MTINFKLTTTTGVTLNDGDNVAVGAGKVNPLDITTGGDCGNAVVSSGCELIGITGIPQPYGVNGPWPVPNNVGDDLRFWAKISCEHEGQPHGVARHSKTVTIV